VFEGGITCSDVDSKRFGAVGSEWSLFVLRVFHFLFFFY